MMQAVQTAPTVVYFDVESSFQSYAGGIYSPSVCGNSINHGK